VVHSPGEAFSLDFGRLIGELLEPGDVLALWGELGAGKTLLTRGIALGLGIPREIPVTSPSFTFMNEYHGRIHLYHLDLYRLGDFDELETLPWREALYGKGVAVVEWPERLGDSLPEERWDIHIAITADEARTFTIIGHGESLEERLEHLENQVRRQAQ
jgi:tRNA threonylcarbamoyladenosine biosynthesis protein TsaE